MSFRCKGFIVDYQSGLGTKQSLVLYVLTVVDLCNGLQMLESKELLDKVESES